MPEHDPDPPCPELVEFANELIRHGAYILPCGGGITAEPRRAILELSSRYGRDELVRLCWELLFEVSPDDIPLHQEASSVAHGMLYHLADAALLRRLLGVYRSGRAGKDKVAKHRERRLELIETLIAGVCHRLELPYPEGIEPLDPQVEHALFLDEDPSGYEQGTSGGEHPR